jgi:hypothetical protein
VFCGQIRVPDHLREGPNERYLASLNVIRHRAHCRWVIRPDEIRRGPARVSLGEMGGEEVLLLVDR